ncbi:3-oxoacyl-ACP reductase FabG [Gammaproteobacteria bacterium]|jgi:3-oxoacyl-[acyl-carrier protein] reductase|nr:3-oxoacyl-ACP reductase FabG [Gammaproteobacteria bacterium]MDC1491592.1 3-oxoacyl-ACP reductase FabG [Gammaproteobacteria bacterium]|tara:strand:- start:2642 stop:3361 length:720 start_codon:yes stop_codon:yes gene_type:complete
MNNIVFITGASKGIGLAMANAFNVNGYDVIGTARSKFDFTPVNKDSKMISMQLDVTNRDNIKSLASNLKEQDLMPSIIINNAGITSDQLFLRMSDDDWDSVIDTNLNGVFNITKVFMKHLIKSKAGRIINISSVSGLMGNPGQVNYSSAKAALGGFTKSLAKEIGSRNITVNSIAPGFIETDMTAFLTDEGKAEIIKGIPLQRLGHTDDISNLALYLASEQASYITGQTISVDGGLFMY